MNRFILASLFIFLAASAGHSADPPEPHQFPAPQGWKTERFALPPQFAPKMQFEGFEELRFAPGMYRQDSDSFLSYAFVFWTVKQPQATPENLERELLAYYRGLSKAVSKGRGAKPDVAKFSLNLTETQAGKDKKERQGHAAGLFTGKLTWIEPFVTGKQQTLNLEIQSWYCEKSSRHCTFVCVSPQKPTTPIWKALRGLRAEFRCHEEK